MWKILRIFDYVHKEMQGKFFLASVQPLLYNILNASKSRCGGMADAPHSKCGGRPCRFESDHRHHQARAWSQMRSGSFPFPEIRARVPTDLKRPFFSCRSKLYAACSDFFMQLQEDDPSFAKESLCLSDPAMGAKTRRKTT